MKYHITLEYRVDDDWYVGRLKEIPGVFSQGESLSELEENIKTAYSMIIKGPFIKKGISHPPLP